MAGRLPCLRLPALQRGVSAEAIAAVDNALQRVKRKVGRTSTARGAALGKRAAIARSDLRTRQFVQRYLQRIPF